MSARRPVRDAISAGTASLFEEAEGPRGEDSECASSSAAQRIFLGAPADVHWTARVLAGIDEAGLGPLLGPLSIGYSAFRVPRGTENLWTALGSACTDDVDDDRERLVVSDSKVVFTRNPRGERRLERTALAFFALGDHAHQCPSTAREMLEGMSRDVLATGLRVVRSRDSFERADRLEPWRSHLERGLPRHAARDEIASMATKLAQAMSSAKIELTDAGVRLVPVPELNASFSETENKSVTHWRATEAVLQHLWRAHGGVGLDLTVDRHGGRMRYAHFLAETFAPCSVHVLLETPPRSEYIVLEHIEPADTAAGEGTLVRSPDSVSKSPSSVSQSLRSGSQSLRSGSPSPRPGSELPDASSRSSSSASGSPRRMRIAFAERAESSSFAVALASCLAKYARETCMDAFNAYFGSLQPGLKPTAGYLDDGRRWLADAGPAIERSDIRPHELVRER